ncbi:kinase/pyrophosphorylase [Vibrio sp. DW001]|uniref:posphoenolpyruvate synthetase regulatory kinase/phosphorylase PpsR n=1 Tax=Vibrio sp. DW001 TaxID=2912315 RepID=UPI0023B1386C|nr:pyruvate, water dikinase regulatory protein [Vibrio sp. DW001]WED29589.1 kinase/pyrophosphorylase [Vibrio sp. DW001]
MQNLNERRDVFYISDGTAITCETLGHAVLGQFPFIVSEQTIPFVENSIKAQEAVQRINQVSKIAENKPVVFLSTVVPDVKSVIMTADAHIYDILGTLVEPIQKDLQLEAKPKLQRSRSVNKDEKAYFDRISAVEYTLNHDDGLSVKDIDQADLILLGVSRSGKTPTSLYMALQFGVRVINYPFISEDMQQLKLLPLFEMHRHKLFGLTIDSERLSEIRHQRLANSTYASAQQCSNELKSVELLFRKEAIPYLNTSSLSVEEISAKILQLTGLKRNLF